MANNPSGPDEAGRRKPVTIDLAAAEVAPKPSAGEPSGPARKPDPDSKAADGVTPSAFAPRGDLPAEPASAGAHGAPPVALLAAMALAGGVVGALAVWLLAASGTLPGGSAEDVAALRDEVAALRTAADAAPPPEDLAPLRAEVAALAARPEPAAASAVADLGARVEALEAHPAPATAAAPAAGTGDLAARLDALSADVDALQSAAPQADTPPDTGLAERVDTLTTDFAALQQSVAALPDDARVSAVDARVETLSAEIGRAAALAPAVAGNALAAAVAAGRPFPAELAALRSLGVDAGALDALAPSAEAGVPSLAALRASFDAAIAPIDLSTPLPVDAGAVQRLLQSARGLVEVRPANPTAGSDPAAIVTRIRAALDRGDVAAALAERAALPEAAKAATEDWARQAEARAAADGLVGKLSADALSRLPQER